MAPLKEAARKAAKTPRAKHIDKHSRQTPQADHAAPDAADRREARRRRETLDVEDEPLQRRILRALSRAPRTPSDLVRELGASKEAISRLLTPLQESGCVEYGRIEGDKRRRLYRLTPDGERTLRGHLRFGAPEPLQPAPGHEQSVALA